MTTKVLSLSIILVEIPNFRHLWCQLIKGIRPNFFVLNLVNFFCLVFCVFFPDVLMNRNEPAFASGPNFSSSTFFSTLSQAPPA